MEELKNDEILFDDKELDELEDKITTISDREEKELKKELDDYFKKNKIEHED